MLLLEYLGEWIVREQNGKAQEWYCIHTWVLTTHLSLGSNITYIIRTGGGNGCMHNCLQWVESFPLSFDLLFSSGGYMPLTRLEEGVVTSRH